jgi:hypothetical protein
MGGYSSGGTYRGYSVTESLLAQRLAPPRDYQPGNGLYGLVTLFSLGAVITLIVTAIRGFILLDPGAKQILPYLYRISMVSFFILLVWVSYRARVMNHEYYHQEYLPQLADWEKRYCCLRCGEQFIP